MSSSLHGKLNTLLTQTLNDILRIEDVAAIGRPNDVTVKEIHVINAVASAVCGDNSARTSDIAAALRVTPGTLTVAIDALQKKGYVTRCRDVHDRRTIRLSLTPSGQDAKAQHDAFHHEITDEVLAILSHEEATALIRALEAMKGYFVGKEASMRRKPVKIIADSTCDLTADEAQRLGVTVIPMSFVIGDNTYRQDIDMTVKEFYAMLETAKAQPTTVQLTPYDLEMAYGDIVSGGYEAVAIHLSSALSGTYQSAVIAAREVKGVYPVDSLNATFGSAILVRAAVKLRDTGMTAAEIAAEISALTKRVRLIAHIPSLKYLVRGGRVSAAAGLIGGALNICPIVAVQDGAVKSLGKARGTKAACQELVRLAETEHIDKTYGLLYGHACDETALDELKLYTKQIADSCETADYTIGAVIGTHTGPGAAGLAFVVK
jgi:DegV family protein with EDD domain